MKEVTFKCNLCGSDATIPYDKIHREGGACTSCGSNVRFRSLVYALSKTLFGKPLVISDFPDSKKIVGIGMSDAEHYADRLEKKFSYTNHFYHTEPFLDITDVSDDMHESCDFIISSDVFEHVLPPRSTAFENTFKILKPGGVFIFSVPYSDLPNTVEYYPDLHNYHVIDFEGRKLLINQTKGGKVELFDGLFWHGGEGSTLELRVFSKDDVIYLLEKSGFENITIYDEDVEEFGIYKRKQTHSFIITAEKPKNAQNKIEPYDNEKLKYPNDQRVEHEMVHYPNPIKETNIVDIIKDFEAKSLGAGSNEEAIKLQQQLDKVYSSTSWKITNPLRKIKGIIKKS